MKRLEDAGLRLERYGFLMTAVRVRALAAQNVPKLLLHHGGVGVTRRPGRGRRAPSVRRSGCSVPGSATAPTLSGSSFQPHVSARPHVGRLPHFPTSSHAAVFQVSDPTAGRRGRGTASLEFAALMLHRLSQRHGSGLGVH